MTDAAPTTPAGWYPDPAVANQQRYWDGERWTEHVHPLAPAGASQQAHGQPGSATTGGPGGPQRPKKKRRGLVIGLVAGGAALAVGVTALFVWGIPALTGPKLVTEEGWAYAYAPLLEDVEPDHTFTFPADYDLEAMARENGDEFDNSFAFEVFTDAALTKHADLSAFQWKGEIDVSPDALSTGRFYAGTGLGYDESLEREFEFNPDGGFFWGLNEEYFLVQKLDRSGEPLEKPIVHPFTIERSLAAPEAVYTADENGTLQVSWDPVDGATEYLVTVSSWDGDRRSVDIVGTTTETSWSPPLLDPFSGEEVEVEIAQNEGLQTYSIWSAAQIADAGSSGTVNPLDNDTSEYEYAVVATDGSQFSSTISTDAEAVAASLPKEIPLDAKEQQFPNGQWVDSLDQIPTRFLFTSLDGATRQTAGYIDPAMVTPGDETSWRLALIGKGTALSWPVRLNAPDRASVDAQIAAYNTRVAAEAPTTGMPEISLVAEGVDADFDQYTPSTVAPDVDYPVYGSNDFTEYLAANLVAREDAIDISEFQDAPGMPELDDAMGEAVYQNPYVLGYRGYSVRDEVVYVSYANDPDETVRLQAEVDAATAAAVASVVTEGMSDAEKATALNGWLVDTAEYDTPAFEASFLSYPDGFEHAWDPSGVLLPENGNVGVCASYAAAYKALLDEAGLESVVVTGDVFDGGGHAWNKVKIDGQWLAVDPTWNDGSDPSAYLLITDGEFVDQAARAENTEWMADLRIAGYATP
ncbi:DUF2510 domain-containing protein [Herbiconiux sp. CPCC 203407]|uniref:DUF2510 domain-containing protein n=1 Tax=Herbiconiux oxytropis TaxID=2970915 RepID=A0AA41XAI9_9MICO|nr:DUF2510 domain-containing protein [Herbiconiux oxytropis]MCS5721555.1 DUF2510 domain-containing protein [Herbiconiux oxytropis]MCS5724632.1 DUF2510 domain-containing protein [Herbiconiux oxytropis]